MNKPDRIVGTETASPPYEIDAYGWSLAQTRLLRERQYERIDWENIAEEIESLGQREKRALESVLVIVLAHQLKWEYQPVYRCRSWENSITEHLRRFDRMLAENPSLKAKLDDILIDAYRHARFEASQETGLLMETFPEGPPSWETIRSPRVP